MQHKTRYKQSLKQKISLCCMAVLYVVAGILHFAATENYLEIMPPWLPYHTALVYISGICEILFGCMLMPPASRRFAAWGIIALLVAVFPANIQMTINYEHTHSPHLWLSILRLPIQAVLIWWALQFAGKRK
jgi:uncharacterized membrane protein